MKKFNILLLLLVVSGAGYASENNQHPHHVAAATGYSWHGNVEESEMVTEDLARLLNDRKGAAQREKLLYVEGEERAYWQLSVDH